MLEQELHKIDKYLEDEEALLKATFSKSQAEWVRVTMRPIIIKGQRYVQFSYYDKRKCTVKNYSGREYEKAVKELLAMGFKNIFVETVEGSARLLTNKKGKVKVNEKAAKSSESVKVDLAHNRTKKYLIPDNIPSDFLEAVGIMTKEGKVKADKQNKFRQLNSFLKIVDETLEKAQKFIKFGEGKLLAVDCGCGNAYLTFAAYDYFNYIVERPLELVGVDVNGELLENHRKEIAGLGWDGLKFQHGKIIDYVPERDPDLVMSLHACDTATDEALFKAITWGSKMIFASPCCHHNVQAQLENAKSELEEFAPILRHGALKERFGDVLTDTFRILILRIMGYQTEIIEFVNSENTNRNLLIRAVKSLPPGDKKTVEEYLALKKLFKIEPHLEKLLGENFTKLLK
ncbi:MAG: methyltransferase [Patescibacteria group bacterium]